MNEKKGQWDANDAWNIRIKEMIHEYELFSITL